MRRSYVKQWRPAYQGNRIKISTGVNLWSPPDQSWV